MGLLQAQGTDNARDYLKTYLASSLTLIDAHDHASTRGAPVKRLQNGTQAGRPAVGNAGHVYVGNDSNRVFFDNGASWLEAILQSTTQLVTLAGGLTLSAGSLNLGTAGAGLVCSSTSASHNLGGGNNVNTGLQVQFGSSTQKIIDALRADGTEYFYVRADGNVFFPNVATVQIGNTVAGAGTIRLPNAAPINWRNSGNSNDHSIVWDASNTLLIKQNLATIAVFNAGAIYPNDTTNAAVSGAFRMLNQQAIAWRNTPNSADISLTIDTSDRPNWTISASTLSGSATAGAAVLPSNPSTFFRHVINGTEYKIPLYLA